MLASLCIGNTNTRRAGELAYIPLVSIRNIKTDMKTIKNRNVSGRPRKSEADKKGRSVTIKFDQNGYESLSKKVTLAGMTTSEYIRFALKKSEVKERLNAQHLRHIIQLTGMANNLNQIARRVNTVGFIATKLDIETLARQIDNVIKSIENDS